jgi:hypothetical protein
VKRRPREIATAPDVSVLVLEVERQGALIARQAAMIDGMAVALIEAQEDVRELRGLVRAASKAPPDMLPLKTAALQAGAHYETVRRWCARGFVHAQRMGSRWWVSLPSLAAELAKRRRPAA